MEIKPGACDKKAKTIAVTFEHNGVSHTRNVNYCLSAKGSYDAEATAARLEEVALGVQNKIELGVITNEAVDLTPAPQA